MDIFDVSVQGKLTLDEEGKSKVCFLFVSFLQKTDAANHAILRIKAKNISRFQLQYFLKVFKK